MKRLSKNFTYSEAIGSQIAERHGIDNTPSREQLIQIVHTAVTMEKVRTLLGDKPIIPSSWFRTPLLNTLVNGKPTNSYHKYGQAIDFRVNGLTNKEVFDLIRESNISYAELILEYPSSKSGGWLHLAIHPFNMVYGGVSKIANRVNGETVYTLV